MNEQGALPLVVAFDNDLVVGLIPGMEDARGQISRFVKARVDALLLNLGLIQRCRDCFPRAGTPAYVIIPNCSPLLFTFKENPSIDQIEVHFLLIDLVVQFRTVGLIML
jgi:DhnA family fructose-bisphosphate aldolase class Ia